MARKVELLWLLPACLAACVPVALEPAGTRMVDTAGALVLPEPGTEEIVGVVQHRYSDALEQEVVLATSASTPGQNALSVRFLGLGRARGDDALSPTVMTDETIAAEMRAAIPGIVMRPSAAYAQNAYGPFGFATGRGDGADLCLYGWQRIQGVVTEPSVRQGAIDVRLRMCRAGASERALLAAMYGYTVRAPFGRGWSTGAPVPVTNAAIGEAGVAIVPVVSPVAEAPVRPVARAVRSEPASVAAPVLAPAPAAPLPPPTAVPLVPAPVGMPSGVPAVVPMVPSPGLSALAAADVPIVPPPPIPVVLPALATGASR